MPDPPSQPRSRDFAVLIQSSDQSFLTPSTNGDDRISSTTQRPPSTASHSEQSNAVASAPAGAQSSSSIARPSPSHAAAFGTYGYNPGGPLAWDWDNSMDFREFYFEPVGELQQELENQQAPTQDFSIPQPVHSNAESQFDFSGAESTTYTSTLTPPATDHSPAGLAPPFPPPPPQRAPVQARPKRKADSEPTSIEPQQAGFAVESQEPQAKRAAKAPTVPQQEGNLVTSRSNSITAPAKPAVAVGPAAEEGQGTEGRTKWTMSDSSASTSGKQAATGPAGRVRTIPNVTVSIGAVLPAGKVFPIQIGSELFRLSGASISSDAPSYFSHFFGEQLYSTAGRTGNIRTLYIDRDPETFRDISLHLQGYHVTPRDGAHFVKLFADAQFYSLPRLTKQLFKSEIFVQIGDTDFRIPRDLFSSPGDSPNYFSLGFAHFFTTPNEVFPGLDRQALLRPPSILPPAIPNRSAEVFADLLRVLQGYPVHIRDEAHRADLLRDARYFHLKGVEQKLIPCEISFNLLRNASEIVIRLEDVRQSGVSFIPTDGSPHPDGPSTDQGSKPTTPSSALSTSAPSIHLPPLKGYVSYARPFTDEAAHTMILELSGPTESTKLDVVSMRGAFCGQTKARIASLFQVIANKLNLPATQPLGLMLMQTGGGVAAQPASPANSGVSGEKVKISIGRDAFVELNGKELTWDTAKDEESEAHLPPCRDLDPLALRSEWITTKAQWRLKVQPSEDESGRLEVVMCAVNLQAYSSERARNGKRKFIS